MDLRHLEVEIEHLKKDIKEIKQKDLSNYHEYSQKLDQIERKLDRAFNQLDMYRHFTIFIRAILVAVIVVITLKFGDIKDMLFGAEVVNETKR